MKPLIGVFAWIWAVAFLTAPRMGAGWAWDAANGLGLAAFVGMLYVSLPGLPRSNVRQHERFGYAVLTLLLAHGLWFVVFDDVALEYLKPGAPMYMWAGIAALGFVVLLMVLARQPRRGNVHRNYRTFQKVHVAFAILAALSAAYHVLGSGYYLRSPIQVVGFVAVLAAILLSRRWTLRWRPGPATPGGYLALSAGATLLFVAIRNGFS